MKGFVWLITALTIWNMDKALDYFLIFLAVLLWGGVLFVAFYGALIGVGV